MSQRNELVEFVLRSRRHRQNCSISGLSIVHSEPLHRLQTQDYLLHWRTDKDRRSGSVGSGPGPWIMDDGLVRKA